MQKIILALCVIVFGLPAMAAPVEFKTASLTISDPFSRATNGENGAVFLKMENSTDTPIKLVKATGDVAKVIELHTHIQEGDVFRMREVDSMEIPAEGAIKLKPGGLHIMLLGLEKSLRQGGKFPLTLTFDNGETLDITVPIRSPGHTGCTCQHKKKS